VGHLAVWILEHDAQNKHFGWVMAKLANQLTVSKARGLKKPGRHADGNGLYLKVRKSGSKYWVFMSKKNGKRTEIGLGAFNDITLHEARKMSEKLRVKVSEGTSLVQKPSPMTEGYTPSFLRCVDEFLKTKESGWKNHKHRAQWHMTLKKYAKSLHNLDVDKVTTNDVLAILQPMWLTKNETASRLRGRIETVLDYAKVMGWRSGENPAVWRGNLKLLLPGYSKRKNVKHHSALPFEDLPQFYVLLKRREALVGRLLEFIILTACRSGEARMATWHEIDQKNMTWTIPAERMKAGRTHIIPLSSRAVEILNSMYGLSDSSLIFPHPTSGKEFSVNATRALLKRMEYGHVTTHGFRSSFRDWAGDQTHYQRETIEAALAHGVKDQAEAAYRRSTSVGKRRILMEDWLKYISNPEVKQSLAYPSTLQFQRASTA